ncbi:MAG TPA: CbiX/SirB N-terminal domain-containing protein [Lacunisphaera sp.]|nr:CbiX/SirB N-terminal domain-containing protein [Lacunisphaera sp.]
MPAPLTLLVDNGSLQPAATLALRGLATKLALRLGEPVEPVSLLHSSAIDAAQLNGRAAEILGPALERRLAAGREEFVIVPLFFGPSQALTAYIPGCLARLREKHPALRARLAPALHAPGDDRLARILADHVRFELAKNPATATRVALVDHGSPVAAVTAVRNELASQLAGLLGGEVAAVAPCSMERRPEPEYDFAAPLLADLLARAPWSEGRVIVAMQFLLPGRHAGVDGDVAKICRAAEAAHPPLRTTMTTLVGAHPLLVEILADRWRAAGPGGGVPSPRDD